MTAIRFRMALGGPLGTAIRLRMAVEAVGVGVRDDVGSGGKRSAGRACEDDVMLRWITAGESHGPALVAVL
ncbi:MAG: hypothetical protein ACRDHG_10960, partial [Anaerolineales bacterium]